MLYQRCVLILIKIVLISLHFLFASFLHAATDQAVASRNQSTEQAGEAAETLSESIKKNLGVTYFFYFYGPGFHPDNRDINPNQLGLPENDGIFFQNQISFRYKFSNNLALDFQSRFKLILNNRIENPDYRVLRWETPRIGISGKLISGTEWTLIGAINTDFPYFFPAPFTGVQAQQRTILFAPGMFASLRYEPRESRWSFFSVLAPRFLLYENRAALDSQSKNSGYSAGNKPEFIIAFQPTLNYKLDTNTKLTIGTNIDYRKVVCSDWNIFRASLISNGEDPAWRFSAVPIYIGVTYAISSYLSIFPYISTFPIAAQRVDGRTGSQASILEATSIGMWMNGTLF